MVMLLGYVYIGNDRVLVIAQAVVPTHVHLVTDRRLCLIVTWFVLYSDFEFIILCLC